MVVVIEKGNGYQLQQRCTGAGNDRHGCNAMLGLSRSDLRYYPESDWGPSSSVSFRCPECGALTDLQKKDWPGRPSDLKHFTKAWMDGNEE